MPSDRNYSSGDTPGEGNGGQADEN